VDEVMRLEAPASPPDPAPLAGALTEALLRGPAPDLVLLGERSAASGRGLLPALVAARLDLPLAGPAGAWSVQQDGAVSASLLTPEGALRPPIMAPAVVAFAPGLVAPAFTAERFLAAAGED